MNRRLKRLLRPLATPQALHIYHFLRAVWANVRFGFPSRGIVVYGVTGTKGKTTTSHLLASILEEAGYTVGLATTVSFKIAGEERANNTNMSVTSPMPLQRLLREMRNAGCNAIVLEVTSIALDQFRTWGVPFRYVGLTNITHDHLDYHVTWTRYQEAKLRLFRWHGLRSAVVNQEDQSGTRFLAETTAKQKWSYSLEHAFPMDGSTSHVWADKISTNPESASFTLHEGHASSRVLLQLPGLFNVENALCAASLALSGGVPLDKVVTGLQKLERVAGRLEKIPTKKGFSVMVDYAHTPDSLEKLYSTLRPDVRGRMIAVLGSCGDRDKTKRPIMGALAARFCDYVFVTDEEPYTEDPLAIIEEVAKGVPRGRALFKASPAVTQRQERPILKKDNESGEGDWWWKVADRREAISRAIDMAKLDDLILVTGMGAQNFRVVGEEKQPWNDRTVIEGILAEKNLL